MLYMKWLTATEASDPILRNAILSNGLINPHGKLDTWHEVDLNIELYNLSLKEMLYAHKNSTFDVDYLFRTAALTTELLMGLRKSIETTVGHRQSDTHTVKSPADDIHALAYYLSRDSVRLHRGGRTSDFEAPDVLSTAIRTISAAVKRFNSTIVYRADDIQGIADEDTDTKDLPADAPLAQIEVRLQLNLLLFSQNAAYNHSRQSGKIMNSLIPLPSHRAVVAWYLSPGGDSA
jgi:hypothetical protein